MKMPRLFYIVCSFLLIGLLLGPRAATQTETATISGLITDDTGAAVPGAEVKLQSVERGAVGTTTTNNAGIYVFPSVQPGQYQIRVDKAGFKQVDFLGLIVNVQDHIEQNFRMQIGSVSESVTVNANDLHINTTDASVSTVVDRQFAENLPLNGRSFQTLIQLTPGVVLTPSNGFDNGQFSVNGQRASANYWMVDGVSANIGVSPNGGVGSGLEGSLGSFSALGGTNSLVSVDALQEFRIQTSTFAPEFGRTPGAQISILTRSGTNRFHGTLFDYLRNDVLDANDWFANFASLPKPKERQNDFGGTFSGPILKDRTFFFFSYEGLRLRLPQTALSQVPDVATRQNAIAAMQPFLNAFPLPNGVDNTATGVAAFNASYSIPSTLDAYSLRIDHRLGDRFSLFGRYNYSPSKISQRPQAYALSTVNSNEITVQTATVGNTWLIGPSIANDIRFNYSRTNAESHYSLDTFGGAVPLTSLPFPNPYTSQNGFLNLFIIGVSHGTLGAGLFGRVLQQQFNIVEGLSIQKGAHNLKFGVDFRRLSPQNEQFPYFQLPVFLSVSAAESGQVLLSQIKVNSSLRLSLPDVGVYAQDTWRAAPRLTLTYGLRWDVNFAPSSIDGPSIPAITGFNVHDLSQLALAPPGTSPYKTTYGDVAPRIGVAYRFSQNANWETVLRGGFGLFFDLASGEISNSVGQAAYPFGARKRTFGGTFPLSSSAADPPAITQPTSSNPGVLSAFDPGLQPPYTLQWNIALDQALGRQQRISATYIGSLGRRLLQTANINAPNSTFTSAILVTDPSSSDYDALQVQFQRQLSHGIQALASYTWSHSIDTGSAGSIGNGANALVPAIGANGNRGPSDFDIRHAFSAGLTYDIPSPKINAVTNAIVRGWSLQTVIQARSAPPVDVFDGSLTTIFNGSAQVRPDVVPGIPLYLFGSQYPGGKAFNNTPGAVPGGCSDGSQSIGPFCPPPTDASGNPLRQGNLARNALRGFGATQWDFAVHRDFPIRESLKLQFRAEMFNVLNHPNFGQPASDISGSQGAFGQSAQMLGQSLSGGQVGGGALSPLYQLGGPRSVQFALKLTF